MKRIDRLDAVLTAVVLAHLAVALAHGRAHQGASVALSPASDVFVLVVIIIGPLAGLAWSWFVNQRAGSWVIATTMAGSLVFGVVNHFVLMSGDHVSQVDAAWRGLFGSTAVLLACIETIGLGVGVWRAVRSEWRAS
jgi:hypothetical protein